jgi:hypothetical protein
MANWDLIPEELQEPLRLLATQHLACSSEFQEAGETVQEWMYDNEFGCGFMIYFGSMINPPEYCDDLAAVGSDYCPRHQQRQEPWDDDDPGE